MDERDDAGESHRVPPPGAWPVPDDDWDGLPRCVPEDDFDADAEMARWVADLEAGRERIPEAWELDGLGGLAQPRRCL